MEIEINLFNKVKTNLDRHNKARQYARVVWAIGEVVKASASDSKQFNSVRGQFNFAF